MTSEIPKMYVKSVDKKTTAGILDNEDTNHNDRDIQIRIRYSCLDHYLQVHQKIQGERKKKKWIYKTLENKFQKLLRGFYILQKTTKKEKVIKGIEFK